MRLLVTGTSGYLGKHLLELLVADRRVTEVIVTSRSKRSHPQSKVRIVAVDLSDPGMKSQLGEDFDAVVHLAGLYDFQESYGNCYTHNVLPTQNLVQKLRSMNRRRHVPLYFASTYAVNFGGALEMSESPITRLPSQRIPYAFTKAVAERVVTDSDVPSAVFRLGILTGRSSDGEVEKPDGAYAFLNWFSAVAGSAAFRKLPAPLRVIPLPGDPDGVLPLIPVDAAAAIFHRALFMEEAVDSPARIYGVYRPESVRIRAFSESVIQEFAPGARGIFVSRVPSSWLKAAPLLFRVSADALSFALRPVPLANPGFAEAFGLESVPRFEEFREQFMRGYHRYRQEVA